MKRFITVTLALILTMSLLVCIAETTIDDYLGVWYVDEMLGSYFNFRPLTEYKLELRDDGSAVFTADGDEQYTNWLYVGDGQPSMSKAEWIEKGGTEKSYEKTGAYILLDGEIRSLLIDMDDGILRCDYYYSRGYNSILIPDVRAAESEHELVGSYSATLYVFGNKAADFSKKLKRLEIDIGRVEIDGTTFPSRFEDGAIIAELQDTSFFVRQWFAVDDVWNKKSLNDRIVYEYQQYQRFGILEFDNYSVYLRNKYQPLYGDDYTKNNDYQADKAAIQYPGSYLENSSVQEFIAQANAKGWEIIYLEPQLSDRGKVKDGGNAYLLAVHDFGYSRLSIRPTEQEGVFYLAVTDAEGNEGYGFCYEMLSTLTSDMRTMVFGHYEQDNDASNGKEPIEWIVLDKNEDGSLVLMSKYALDCKPYNSVRTDVTWRTCTLREWLNDEFYKTAFNAEERSKIVPVLLENEDNQYIHTKGGWNTWDKVWLLAINESRIFIADNKPYSYFVYFYDDSSRMCMPTKYALAQGANQGSKSANDGADTCWWWLRSPGCGSWYAAYVGSDGSVDYVGNYVDDVGGIRPVVCVLP